jgi:hypothetical protein
VDMQFFEKGMTICELKTIVKNLPEIGADGEPLEVWIETGHDLSSIVTSICTLNRRNERYDILLSSNAFE